MAERLMRAARTVTQATIDRYAELSLDFNRLHVDPAYAASGPFGRTILHGTIPCAVLFDLVESQGIEFPLIAEFTFLAPAYSEAELEFSVSGSVADGFKCTTSSGDQLVVVGSVRTGE